MPLFIRSSGGEGDSAVDEWTEAKGENGRELLQLVYDNYEVLANEFRSKSAIVVNATDSLYASQREFAVVPAAKIDDAFTFVGSDDATTCHIVILHHSKSNTAAVAHFDDADTPAQLKTFLKAITSVLEETGAVKSWEPLNLDTWIIGGFMDKRGASVRLSTQLLRFLHTQPSSIMPPRITSINFQLKMACITKLNTSMVDESRRNSMAVPDELWPAVFGAAIDLKTSNVFSCTFESRGPEGPLRSARHFSDQTDLLNVYNYKTKRVQIEPFQYYRIDNAESILELPDEWILQRMSTSPNIQPPHFAAAVREMLRFTISNPDWRDVFKDGPVEYEKQTGKLWVKVNKS